MTQPLLTTLGFDASVIAALVNEGLATQTLSRGGGAAGRAQRHARSRREPIHTDPTIKKRARTAIKNRDHAQLSFWRRSYSRTATVLCPNCARASAALKTLPPHCPYRRFVVTGEDGPLPALALACRIFRAALLHAMDAARNILLTSNGPR